MAAESAACKSSAKGIERFSTSNPANRVGKGIAPQSMQCFSKHYVNLARAAVRVSDVPSNNETGGSRKVFAQKPLEEQGFEITDAKVLAFYFAEFVLKRLASRCSAIASAGWFVRE